MKLPVSVTTFSCALVTLFACAGCGSVLAMPPGAVATVNGVPVLKSTIDSHLWRESGAVTLDFMIKSRILLDEAAKRGITLSPEDLQTRMLEYKTTFLTAAGHTPLDWQNFVARFGLKNIEAQQRDSLLAVRIGDDEAAKTVLTPDEEARVRADLTRAAHKVRARIALVGIGAEFGGRLEAAAKERADAARAALDAGKTWDAVSLEFSDDVSTRSHGGDLGFVTREQVEKPLEDFLFSAKPGPESRRILRLGSGYAVAEVVERKDILPTEADIKKAMDETLARKKGIAKEVSTWFPKAEKACSIQRQLPYQP
ncbi:MAG TPA: peptidylprolyl isomerase [Armatimonadota bacterium]